MEMESSRRRKYLIMNRKNVLIERKYETEIRRYERETLDMLGNHLHNTIQLRNILKQVKRNSGQTDEDMYQVSLITLVNTRDIIRYKIISQ